MVDNARVNLSNKLKGLGVNTTVLSELSQLALYNPDQFFILNKAKPDTAVSILLLQNSKRPKKLLKVLKTLGIYNVISLDIQSKIFTFICKTSEGLLITSEVVKNKDISYTRAFSLALLDFINQIQTKEYKESELGALSFNIEPGGKVKITTPEEQEKLYYTIEGQ